MSNKDDIIAACEQREAQKRAARELADREKRKADPLKRPSEFQTNLHGKDGRRVSGANSPWRPGQWDSAK